MDYKKSWPDYLPFSSCSHSHELPMELLRLLMFSANERSVDSSLFEKNRVHANLCVEKLSHFVPNHPLAKQRTLSGNDQHGVFATKVIPQGEVIGEYVGRIYYFSSEEEKLTPFSEYKWTIVHPHYTVVVDSQYGANELALINDYRGIANGPNVEPCFVSYKGSRYFSYITSREIFPQEELLVDYGDQFWSLSPSL
ncbi:MAG: SET domain-containing protein [Chlamydiae bacterium]|nr:SET domain-containing protein [Chlamydiota bacterium]